MAKRTERKRFCVECRSPGPFSSERSFLCKSCSKQARQKRTDYNKDYHYARSRAVARLIRLHKSDYLRYLEEERRKLNLEEETAKAS